MSVIKWIHFQICILTKLTLMLVGFKLSFGNHIEMS